MNALKRAQYGSWTLAAVVALALPIRAWAQPGASPPQAQEEKSAEDILKKLLGAERGIGGMRVEEQATTSEQPHVAVPIRFNYNSAAITADSVPQLDRVAQALNDPRLRSARIRIEGHTDIIGSDAYNLRLSQRRADAVKQFLVAKKGIAASRLIAIGYGKTRPLPGVSQDTEAGRAATRRVEFVNLSTGASATEASERPAAEERPLTVDVTVMYEKGGQNRVLTPGSVLTAKDNYRVTFVPDRTGYVYVYQIDSTGRAGSVFPNLGYSPARNPVQGKQRYMVPPEGKWLMLDQHPGEEEIVVLASENELADPKVMVERMHGSPLDSTTRGPAPSARGDVVPEMPPGVFTYRLPFQHR
jgi:outer membrane protein OmpA-like peptidoglycan-associated protein